MKSLFFVTCFLFSIALLGHCEEKPKLAGTNLLKPKIKTESHTRTKNNNKLVRNTSLLECLQKASECEKEACAPPIELETCHTYTYIHVCKKLRAECKTPSK